MGMGSEKNEWLGRRAALIVLLATFMNTRLAVLALVLAACDGEAPANPDGGGLDGGGDPSFVASCVYENT